MSNNATLAAESIKTKKTREKLQKYYLEIDQNVTPQSLAKKSLEIHRWIACHTFDRVVLHSKSIALFDENQNSAKLSHKSAFTIKKLC